jgi:hypothetical protein
MEEKLEETINTGGFLETIAGFEIVDLVAVFLFHLGFQAIGSNIKNVLLRRVLRQQLKLSSFFALQPRKLIAKE